MNIQNHFQDLTLSPDQKTALDKLESFLKSDTPIFMLKGYAGSGKTTIIEGLVKYLESIDRDFALMAPTGRAAKVIREKTGQEAHTIHKSIYSYEDMVETEEGESFYYAYKIRNDIDIVNKVFIVDEASMISDNKSEGEFFRFGSGYLLTDLISYTRVNNENVRSKIIFVGDPCQLPPVGDNSSKAFDREHLQTKFNLSSQESIMKEVKRQKGTSGILKAAERIRKSISSGFFNDFNLKDNSKDIFNPPFNNFLKQWEEAESPKVIIAYKNKTCLDLNLQIREKLWGNGNLPVQKGDIVIVGGNNYNKGVFNGEFAVVNTVNSSKITRTIALRGKAPVNLTWREIELVFPDAGSQNKVVKGYIIENFLYGDNYLTSEEQRALYVDFCTRHKHLKPKTKQFKEAIAQDDFFNSVKIKFGYAVTCHKAQGGEWENVFTIWDHDNNKGFDCFSNRQNKSGKTNESFYRWAYTAITRASGKLYALNPPFFNSYSLMTFLDDEVISSLNMLTGGDLQSDEIELDTTLLGKLEKFQLLDQPIPIQDHFIKIRHAVRKQYIDIVSWERKNSEIFYTFGRDGLSMGVRTWVKKGNVFNGKYQKLPTQTNNEEFYEVVLALINKLPNINIVRNTSETILKSLEFEYELEEQFPITRNLFDDLNLLLKNTSIVIDDLHHMPYKERYTFVRNQEKAVIDFEYKKNCFLGRVLPLKKNTNSPRLILDIKEAILSIKQD